ncbi:non-ribosomal peptide synthetase [Nocardiopsis baichengensis]|uniref:non-ribosomal peptide synthetase n=1 Tax=Nocardiopsis baichengensis TaxID=280240 RepID=UPI00034CB590|nr:non-ribosomal peptide synthetase [Nocardiopsis baichengensis]
MPSDPCFATGPVHNGPGQGLHEIFARRAAEAPGAPALVGDGTALTYGALDRTADAWAERLADAGAGPGSFVPILLPRGIEAVTAALAVLKTGAAYALLDPGWPAPRIREILDRLTPPLAVAGAEGTPSAPPGTGVPVWTPPRGRTAPSPAFRPAVARGTDPACIFFTSGTTGAPKGVVSPHRATSRLFRPGGLALGATVPLAAPTSWDAFSLELWSPLLTGGASVVADDPYLTPAFLAEAVPRHGVDTAWITAGLFNMLVDEAPGALTGLRRIMVGGERLSPGHVRRFLDRHPSADLYNGYGPVESTVFATTHRVTARDCDRDDGIPLGRPVPGTQVYVLDGDRICEPGRTGEICIAGEGLALRYLGDPALTREKFAHLRIGGERTRVYRTGDLGLWGEDGLLRFRGRADRQVKLRGHRVEPAQIERRLERLAPVRSARIVARRDAGGAVRDLVAFCVPARPGERWEEVSTALRAQLPAYELPSSVVGVDAFPLTPQGKLDEAALLRAVPAAAAAADPPGDRAAGDGGRCGAHDDAVLRAVAAAFAAVLGPGRTPVDASFFELGGSSLDAGRVCSRLAESLDRAVPVSRLYQYPSASALAAWLRSAEPRPTGDGGGAADRADRAGGPDAPGGAVPLTPMQSVYLTRQLTSPSDRTGYCTLVWRIDGEPDPNALEAATAAVHRRHEPLRAAYTPFPVPSAVPADVPAPPLEVLGPEPSSKAALRALRAELSDGLLLEDGEVWRTVLVPLSSGDRWFFGCVVHHIAFDGWSESVLADDLAAAYNAALEDREAPGPEPPSLERLHSTRIARLSHSDDRSPGLREELRGVPPIRWPRRPVGTAPGPPGRVAAAIPAHVADAADRAAAAAGTTRFCALLHAWSASLAEVTGQWDFALGVPAARRDGPGLEHAVGCHITMLCVRMRGAALGEGPDALTATARLVRGAFSAQEADLEDLAEAAGAVADGRPPIYQTLMALQDNRAPELELSGVRASFIRQPYLDLPLELHAELWPEAHGGLRLELSYRPEAVAGSTCRDLAERFSDRLHALVPGAPS